MYDGQWERDLRNGEGTCIYSNGDVYTGKQSALFVFTHVCVRARACEYSCEIRMGTSCGFQSHCLLSGRASCFVHATCYSHSSARRTTDVCNVYRNAHSQHIRARANTCAHQATGIMTCDTGGVDWCGLMATHMKEAGKMTIFPPVPRV